MNDEYLWQKAGEDPEIEKLEKVLAVFRYRESISPAIVASSVAVEEKPPRWRMSLTFAFATCLAVAILAIAWIQLAGPASESVGPTDLAFVNGSEDPVPTTPAVAEPPAIKARDLPSPPARNRGSKINPTTASVGRHVKAKDPSVREGVATLSAEERFAYRQLMLALSISSSKFKIVQNALDGAEDTESSRSSNQR